MAYPMGETKLEPLRVDFDRRLKLEFHIIIMRYQPYSLSYLLLPCINLCREK